LWQVQTDTNTGGVGGSPWTEQAERHGRDHGVVVWSRKMSGRRERKAKKTLVFDKTKKGKTLTKGQQGGWEPGTEQREAPKYEGHASKGWVEKQTIKK